MQMECSLEAKEKLAIKAFHEADELRLEKLCLEEMLQNSSVHYEAKMLELSSQGQIKLKENALDDVMNSHMEKETDHQDKIEELERRLDELRQSTERLCEQKPQKVATEDLNLAVTTYTEDENLCQTLSTESSMIVDVMRKRNINEFLCVPGVALSPDGPRLDLPQVVTISTNYAIILELYCSHFTIRVWFHILMGKYHTRQKFNGGYCYSRVLRRLNKTGPLSQSNSLSHHHETKKTR
ncbi:hypothetical protein RND71_019024 [Anisodus tanguticus]|uniref:Uncharacterized protein n=1 Tax=Anisodus tanguticus TaxID=243964 RepID=A0AAE1S6U1_9SOLA|nr:hypothetical protein RND71_019024 [Anisodus tanguticus]